MLSDRKLVLLTTVGLVLPLALVAFRYFQFWHLQDPADCTAVTLSLEEIDNVSSLPSQPLLVLGARMAARWPDKPAQIAGRSVLVRSVDGMSAAMAAACFERLVGHYQPRDVLLLLDRRDLQQLETALTDAVVDIDRSAKRLEINMQLWVGGLLATPARDRDRVRRLNRAVAETARRLGTVHYIDLNTALDPVDQSPGSRHFWPDGDTVSDDSMPLLATFLEQQLSTQSSGSNAL